MGSGSVRLKAELRQKHWQTYSAFCREYDRVARQIDPALVGSGPGRAQFYRWLGGELKGLPYPDHCRVLEGMFPGHTAAKLFAPIMDQADHALSAVSPVGSSGRVSKPGDHHRTGRGWCAHPDFRLVIADGGSSGGSVDAQLIAMLPPLQDLGDHGNLDIGQLAQLAGHIVDLDAEIDIHIGSGGAARLTYRYHTLNLSDRPLTRVQRELWFEHTAGGLTINPFRGTKRRLAIQRLHDTPNLSKFACQISPAVQPGESADISYTCDGGRFVDSLYWRQSVYRYTRRFAINLRHADAGYILSCSALEEYPDGSERSVSEDLIWDDDSNDVTVRLTREYLRPNQSITLRWDVAGEHA